MKKKLLISSIFVVIIGFTSILVLKNSNILPQTDPNPNADLARAMATQYYSLIKNRQIDEALAMIYMTEENTRLWWDSMEDLYIRIPIVDFKILDIVKYTDELYGIEMWVYSEIYGEEEFFNYILYRDGEWLYLTNARDVPDEVYYFEPDPMDQIQILGPVEVD